LYVENQLTTDITQKVKVSGIGYQVQEFTKILSQLIFSFSLP